MAELATVDREAVVSRRPSRSFLDRFGEFLYPTTAVVLIIAAWEALVRAFSVPTYLLPPPSKVAVGLVESWNSIFTHSLFTLQEILLGFLVSVLVGIPLAMLIVSSKIFEKSIYPLLVGSQVVPKVAIAPLFIVWFGFGMTPKVLVAFLIAFFPVVIDSVVGLRSVEIEKLYLARSMGASPLQTFLKIRLPQALPSMLGGLKISITLAVVGAIVGEFIGADRGIGRILLIANGNLDTVLLFAAITALTFMGVVLFLVMDILERIMIPWHVSKRTERLTGTM